MDREGDGLNVRGEPRPPGSLARNRRRALWIVLAGLLVTATILVGESLGVEVPTIFLRSLPVVLLVAIAFCLWQEVRGR